MAKKGGFHRDREFRQTIESFETVKAWQKLEKWKLLQDIFFTMRWNHAKQKFWKSK